MQDDIILHSYRRCPFAMRVRMTLHEKNLSFKTIEENLNAFSDKLLKVNPEARVPVLIHNERVILESAVITEFLEDSYSGTEYISLMPIDPFLRSQVRYLTHWCDEIFKPDLDVLKYGVEKKSSESKMNSHLEKLETVLSSEEFLVGSKFSLADIHLFPFYRQLTRINPKLECIKSFPFLNLWLDKITSREAFKKTMAK